MPDDGLIIAQVAEYGAFAAVLAMFVWMVVWRDPSRDQKFLDSQREDRREFLGALDKITAQHAAGNTKIAEAMQAIERRMEGMEDAIERMRKP